MSLVNQLIAAVVAVLIGLASGTLYIMSDSGKSMLLKQLESHAQDSATHLGLYIAPFMSQGDRARIETAVNAIFDSGFYQRIEVLDAAGKPLFAKETPADISPKVPAWFVNWVHITPPSMSRSITHDWRHVGTIRVQSRAGYAYERFWEAAQRALALFVVLALASALLIGVLLSYLLRPLRRVEQQALALAQKCYIEQPELPRTRELRSVVQAMNEMVRQVRHMFDEQARSIDELRNLAYRDPLTGLSNQRATLAQLQELVDYEHNTGPTSLLLFKIRELGLINRSLGEDDTNHLLRLIAESLNAFVDSHTPSLLGRTGGGEFLLLIGRQPMKTLKPELTALLEKLGTYLQNKSSDPALTRLPFLFGVSHSGEPAHAAQMLSEAKLALQRSEQEGVAIAEHAALAGIDNSSRSWQQHVAAAIGNGQVFLQYQNLFDRDGQPLHGELLARILDEENEPCPAGRFISVVRELGLLDAMDRAVIQRALAYLLREPQGIAISINLGQDSLLVDEFPAWLGKQLAACAQPQRISFEISETAILNHTDRVLALRQQLKALGCGFGVDNFGVHPSGFSYLYSLQPDYLKIDGSLSRDIDSNDEDRFFVRSLIAVAHNLHIKAYAEHIERDSQRQQLLQFGIDGCQGYLHGKPEALN